MLIDAPTARSMRSARRPGWRRHPRPSAQAWTVAALLLVAAAAYALAAPWHSFDADHWFVPWVDQMRTHPWKALGAPMRVETDGAAGFANYNPPTLYLLALGSLLGPLLDALQVVKAVAVAGTLACAACVFVLVRRFTTPGRAAVAGASFLVLPTVVLNGAGWGQTDAIYSGLMALTVAAAVGERWALMLLAFGGALAFKLPAVFLGPFLLYVAISRRVPLRLLPLTPLAYLASLAPAWLAGRSARDLAGVYLDQAETYRWLSMKAPNPWAIVQHLGLMPYGTGVAVGTALALAAGLGIAGLAFRRRLEGTDLLLLALASVTLMPFLLPKMHDRYFFPADVLSFAYAVARPGRRSAMTAACIQAGSLAAYSSILFGVRSGPTLGATCMAGALVLIGLQLRHAWPAVMATRRSDAAIAR